MKKLILTIVLLLIALYLLFIYYPIETATIWALCSLFLIIFIAIAGRKSKETMEILEDLNDSLENKDDGIFRHP